MKLISIYFIFSLFISPIFGDIDFHLDFSYEHPTFNLTMNNSKFRVLFTTNKINPNISIAITPIKNCQKPQESGFCYPYELKNYTERRNETFNVNSITETGPVIDDFFRINYENVGNMYFIYAGSLYGGVFSFDELLISRLYESNKIYRKTISIFNQKYYTYNASVENTIVRIGDYMFNRPDSLNVVSPSKTIEINEIDFGFSARDFTRNALSIIENKCDTFLIEFFHYLDSDSVYGPSETIEKVVTLLKKHNFTCSEVEDSIICDSSLYYGFFKHNSHGIQFNHLKFKKSDKYKNLIFGIRTIPNLQFQFDYSNNILNLASYNDNSDYGIFYQYSKDKQYDNVLSYLFPLGFSFLLGGIIIP